MYACANLNVELQVFCKNTAISCNRHHRHISNEMYQQWDSTVLFRLPVQAEIGMQNCKRPRDMNPPTEAKMTRDDLDSIGGFKLCDLLHFCIPSLARVSNLKNTVCTLSHTRGHVSLWLLVALRIHHMCLCIHSYKRDTWREHVLLWIHWLPKGLTWTWVIIFQILALWD